MYYLCSCGLFKVRSTLRLCYEIESLVLCYENPKATMIEKEVFKTHVTIFIRNTVFDQQFHKTNDMNLTLKFLRNT